MEDFTVQVHDEAVLDQDALRRLRTDLGIDFKTDLPELVELYRLQLRSDIISLVAVLAADDRPQLVMIAHRLRGASLTLGAIRPARLCVALEQKQRPHNETAALIEALSVAGEEAATALELLTGRFSEDAQIAAELP